MHKIVLFFILLSLSSSAATYNSQTAGDWNTSSSWDNGVPNSNPTTNNDVINVMHSITLNGNLEVRGGSTLNVLGCDTLFINGDVIFKNNSIVNVASCAVLVINGSVTNENNSNQIFIDGIIKITGNFTGGNKSILSGGGSMQLGGSLTLNGSGNNTAQVFGITASCPSDCNIGAIGALPVELVSFAAEKIEHGIQLSWTTASETNCNYYEILRSRDGYEFESIEIISGSGTTSDVSSYSFLDNNPTQGLSYYRLYQYDYDGAKHDLGIVSVMSAGTIEMRIYPNPVMQGTQLHLALSVDQSQTVQIKLHCMNGSVNSVSNAFDLYKGNNNITLPSYENIVPGIYFIEVIGDRIRQQLKFIVY